MAEPSVHLEKGCGGRCRTSIRRLTYPERASCKPEQSRGRWPRAGHGRPRYCGAVRMHVDEVLDSQNRWLHAVRMPLEVCESVAPNRVYYTVPFFGTNMLATTGGSSAHLQPNAVQDCGHGTAHWTGLAPRAQRVVAVGTAGVFIAGILSGKMVKLL